MFTELKSGVQLAIILGSLVALTSGITGVYFWHKSKVNTAVATAVKSIELDYAKQNLKIRDRAFEATWQLDAAVQLQRKAKDENLKAANARYTTLVEWVRNQTPSPSTSNYGIPISTGDTKASDAVTIGFLTRSNGINLAGYAKDAETIRLELVSCYNQYDLLRDSLNKFKKENSKVPTK